MQPFVTNSSDFASSGTQRICPGPLPPEPLNKGQFSFCREIWWISTGVAIWVAVKIHFSAFFIASTG